MIEAGMSIRARWDGRRMPVRLRVAQSGWGRSMNGWSAGQRPAALLLAFLLGGAVGCGPAGGAAGSSATMPAVGPTAAPVAAGVPSAGPALAAPPGPLA